MKRLSADLTRWYGDGFSESNLFSMRKCARLYAWEDLDPALLWSHYRVLVTVGDAQQRKKLEDALRRGEMSCRDLALAASRLRRGAGKTADWTLRRGRTGLYRLEERRDGAMVLDAGFGLKLHPACLGAQLTEGLAPRSLVEIRNGHVQAVPGLDDCCRHCYAGRVLRVVDGDTLILDLERARGVYAQIRVRLNGLDAPEAATPEGALAARYLGEIVPEDTRVLALTHQGDSYGRWIADVLAGDGNEVLTNSDAGYMHINRVLAESRRELWAQRWW